MTPTFPHISGRFILPTLAAVVLVAGCFGAATVNHTPGTIMRAVMADGLEGNPDNCTKCHYAWARRFEYYHGWDRYGYVFTDRTVIGNDDPWLRPDIANTFETYYATDWWKSPELYPWPDNIAEIAPSMSILAHGGLPAVPASPGEVQGGRALVVAPENAEFTRIGDAVNKAKPGDTVFVMPGTYNETVVLEDGVNLVGADAKTTIINPLNRGHGVVATNNSLIAGFTLTGTGIDYSTTTFNAAVYVSGCDSTCIIMGNIFRENGLFGVWIDGTRNERACNRQTKELGTLQIEVCDRLYIDYPNPVVAGNTFYRVGQRGVFCVHARGEIFNNVFAGNVKALGLEQHSRPLFHHNVCYFNNVPTACNRSEPVIWNNIFSSNQWGQRMLRGANPVIFGNLTWNSPFFRDFDENGLPIPYTTRPGTGEMTGNPFFTDPMNGDFTVNPGSPAAGRTIGMDAVGIMRDPGLPQPAAITMANSWGREVLSLNDTIVRLTATVDSLNARIGTLAASYRITYESWLDIVPDDKGDTSAFILSPTPVVRVEYDVPDWRMDGSRREKDYRERITFRGATTEDAGRIVYDGTALAAESGRFAALYDGVPDSLFIGERPSRETYGGFYRDYDQYVKGAIGPIGTFYNGYWHIMGGVVKEGREPVDGHECIVVRYPHIGKDQYYLFYLDPAIGFRPRKMEQYNHERLCRVVDGYVWQAYSGGMYLPLAATVTDYAAKGNFTGERIAVCHLEVDPASVSVRETARVR